MMLSTSYRSCSVMEVVVVVANVNDSFTSFYQKINFFSIDFVAPRFETFHLLEERAC